MFIIDFFSVFIRILNFVIIDFGLRIIQKDQTNFLKENSSPFWSLVWSWNFTLQKVLTNIS